MSLSSRSVYRCSGCVTRVSEANNSDEPPETGRGEREGEVRTPTGTSVLACVLSAALLLSGCDGTTTGGGTPGLGDDAGTGGELLLQPAADPGPDPFTDSTALTAATPSPAPRTPDGTDRAFTASNGPRSLSGATPGLYGGTERTGSCDIGRQIGHLTRDPARGRAFAEAAGISPASVPDHVRALTPVVLRADTRVTGNGFGPARRPARGHRQHGHGHGHGHRHARTSRRRDRPASRPAGRPGGSRRPGRGRTRRRSRHPRSARRCRAHPRRPGRRTHPRELHKRLHRRRAGPAERLVDSAHPSGRRIGRILARWAHG
ncbi:DUF6777 domain-containing protein [Streptomyces collinus]|uniref:DUF6777 domain-containing protein n=1 Tax=Streptomyces collinus TaxID=42684 RepID=UPI00368BE96A